MQIIGPVQAETSWQKRGQTGSAVQDFALDWQNRVATCPQGKQSLSWAQRLAEVITFSALTCRDCLVREQCTHNQTGRTLPLNPEEAHQALVQRREEQSTSDFLKRYNRRAGIEGTISQAVRTTRMRRSPYQGIQKTHLHHVAAGINLVRIGAHLQAQACGKPSRQSRPRSHFARLRPLEAV